MNNVLVLIPHFNDVDGLIKSLSSISSEEHVDVLVIDDGSSVTPENSFLESFCKYKGRLIVRYNDKNYGIEKTLNHGLCYASNNRYDFVGRLDAGDSAFPERFKKQKKFLLDNELVLCGTWVDFVDEGGNHLFTFKPPSDDVSLRKAMKRYNPFVHPAVMFRANVIKVSGCYPLEYPALEDWAYFMKIAKLGNLGVMPEILTEYVVSQNSISTKKRFTQGKSKVKLLLFYFSPDLDSIVGVVKSVMILLFPRRTLTFFKKVLKK